MNRSIAAARTLTVDGRARMRTGSAARWAGLTLAEGQHFTLHTASVSRLGFDTHHPERCTIELWNDSRTAPSDATAAR